MSSANEQLGLAEIAPILPERRRSYLRSATAVGMAVLAMASGADAMDTKAPARASGDQSPLVVGGFDSIGEQLSPRVAGNVISKIRTVGFGDLKEMVTWVPGQKKVSPADELALSNSIEAASQNNMDVTLLFAAHTWGKNAIKPPSRPNQQRDFCDEVVNTLKKFPRVTKIQIENEPNNPLFWPNQFKPDGTDNLAVAYEALLARCYDAVKASNPDVEVVAGGLSPWGNDDPHSGRPSHSPTTFIANLGAVYAASGRNKPIMDAFGLHPYLKNGDTMETTHPAPSTTIDAADYPKLVKDLSDAFDFRGSAQPGADLAIEYDEFAEKTSTDNQPGTVTPAAQAHDYAELLHMARCDQPTVEEVIFFKIISNPDWPAGMYDASGQRTSNFYPIHNAVEDAQAPSANC